MGTARWTAVRTSGGYGVLKVSGEALVKSIIVRDQPVGDLRPPVDTAQDEPEID